jgi:acyl dehydratase
MTDSLTYSEVVEGSELPELAIPITRTLIVATALASRDYQDVHHDHELAEDRGSPDIFMNILTSNGLVGRYITDWTGPAGIIEAIDIRLGVPNYPGDTMTMSGTVTKLLGESSGRGSIEVRVRGANRLGDHVSGTVKVSLPLEAPA